MRITDWSSDVCSSDLRVVRCVSASSPVPGFQRPAMVQPRKRMRQNLPVTQNETTFPDGDTIVSVTDLKGKISHCNAAFVKISGFQTEELLGQPQNSISHPDMPATAFSDTRGSATG